MSTNAMLRRLGPIGVRGMYAAELRSARVERGLVADLSLGVWRSQQAARDLCAQLDLSAAVSRRLSREYSALPGEPPTHSRIGKMIDSETQGDAVTLAALELAAAVHGRLRQRGASPIYVLLGNGAASWELGDVSFLAFLAQGLRDTRHELRFVACGSELPQAPPGFEVSWPERRPEPLPRGAASPWAVLPGIVSPDLFQLVPNALGLQELANGCYLVPPELRRSSAASSGSDVQWLADTARAIPWLAAYAAYHGAPDARSFPALWRQARREFEGGNYSLALRYLSRALELSATAHDRSACQLFMQGVRLRAQQYDVAAEQDDPEDIVSDELQAWLWHAKGWALTFRGEHSRADTCLERARNLLQSSTDREGYLYVTNILALNALQGGQIQRALSLESEIREAILTEGALSHDLPAERRPPQQQGSGLWQLRYINHLNLARLHKAQAGFDESAIHYASAFATSDGARSDSDLIYLHTNLARLEEGRGRPTAALVEWLRAAVLWASSPAPEALASRVVAALLGERMAFNRHELCERLAARFTGKLLDLASSLGLGGRSARVERAPISWVRAEHLEPSFLSSHPFHLLGAPHLAAFATEATAPPVASSLGLERFGLTLLSLLGSELPPGIRSVVVHDQYGRDLPQSAAEMLGSCLQLGLGRLRVASRELAFDAALTAAIEADTTVLPSPAISSCASGARGIVVSFKRYRGSLELEGDLGRAVALAVASGGVMFHELAVALECDATSLRSLLRDLDRRRLTSCRVSAQAAALSCCPSAFQGDPLRPFEGTQ